MSMIQKIKKVGVGLSAGVVSALFPLVAFAATAPFTGAGSVSVRTVGDFFAQVRYFINGVTPLIIGLAVFVIIWGIFQLIIGTSRGDEDTSKKARSLVLWGVLGVFVMISIWGLVNILKNTFSLDVTPVSDIKVIP